ncbi:ATP-binding protein [Streptomyces sp. NPDC059373]
MPKQHSAGSTQMDHRTQRYGPLEPADAVVRAAEVRRHLEAQPQATETLPNEETTAAGTGRRREMSVDIAPQLHLVARVRHAVVGALRLWGVLGIADDMGLIATELVGNAIRHGSGDGVGVLLAVQDGLALLEVTDGTREEPTHRQPEDGDEDGRGLLIVRALAKDCGWRINGRGGTTVWATMPFPLRRAA